MVSIGGRLMHAWNVFRNRTEELEYPTGGYSTTGAMYGRRPDRTFMTISSERSIVTSIYTRIAIDAAAIDMEHVILDEDGRYTDTVKSGLNNCLTVEANLDQGGRMFKQDMVLSLLDWGVIAIVPVETTLDPTKDSDSWDIKTVRIAQIVAWYPRHVTVDLYNEELGVRQQVTLPKTSVGIVENPLYPVMNEQNSTMQRLLRKLALLDVIDEQSSSGKLDLIIQLPYVIKSEAKQEQAENRRKAIEMQLKDSKYGIAYTDATEKITQLNRPAENNLLNQVEMLTQMVYGQLGITKGVMEGTASEQEMLNYYVRTIEPILAACAQAMKRIFLSKTARTRGHSIEYYRDPFRLLTMDTLAELADKLTRNEIFTSNDMRAAIGFKPSKDPKANELRNKNLPIPEDPEAGTT